MSKFCPKCGSEFKNQVEKCPDDNAKLKDHPPKLEQLELLDIYAARDSLEADYLTGTLRQNNIEANQERRGLMSQITPYEEAHHIVSVHPKNFKKAKEMIKTARENELISDLGAYLA